ARQLDAPRPPAPVHAAVQRLQPEEGEPPCSARPLLRLLQLLPDAPEHPDDAGDEGRPHPEALDRRRADRRRQRRVTACHTALAHYRGRPLVSGKNDFSPLRLDRQRENVRASSLHVAPSARRATRSAQPPATIFLKSAMLSRWPVRRAVTLPRIG